MSISDRLRAAIVAAGTVYRVAKGSGVSQPVLWRFLRGERGLTLDTVDKLAEFLRLDLSPAPKARFRKAAKRSKREG